MYRTGKTTMSEEHRIKAAELLNEDPIIQLMHGRLERAKCTDVKNIWQDHLEKLTAAALGILLTFATVAYSPDTHAETASNGEQEYTLCALAILKWLLVIEGIIIAIGLFL